MEILYYLNVANIKLIEINNSSFLDIQLISYNLQAPGRICINYLKHIEQF